MSRQTVYNKLNEWAKYINVLYYMLYFSNVHTCNYVNNKLQHFYNNTNNLHT
jgi:hypothetical protein